jgi:hypothetical protein
MREHNSNKFSKPKSERKMPLERHRLNVRIILKGIFGIDDGKV